MAFEEQLPRKFVSKEKMMKRVARFKDLKGFDDVSEDKWVQKIKGFRNDILKDKKKQKTVKNYIL